jgi:anti-sigma B factor antagonist
MEIKTNVVQQVKVITIIGEVDGNTAPAAQEQILALAGSGVQMILDMSQVNFMSSAGLRMLLMTYRAFSSKGGKVVLVGLSEDLEDTMSLTGFLDFFDHYDSLQDGVASLA